MKTIEKKPTTTKTTHNHRTQTPTNYRFRENTDLNGHYYPTVIRQEGVGVWGPREPDKVP